MVSLDRVAIGRMLELPMSDIQLMLSESEAEGFHFVRRVLDEWQGGVNRFDRPGDGLLGATVGEATVGIVGLMLDPYARREGVGRLRNLYVRPAFRGVGIGAGLSRAVIAAAQPHFRLLRLRAGTPEAARLYDRLGFVAVAGDVDCTHQMVLDAPTA